MSMGQGATGIMPNIHLWWGDLYAHTQRGRVGGSSVGQAQGQNNITCLCACFVGKGVGDVETCMHTQKGGEQTGKQMYYVCFLIFQVTGLGRCGVIPEQAR